MTHTILAAMRKQNPTGLWLLHGDEPLVAAWVVDSWRKQWQTAQVTRKRIDGKSAKSWREALAEFSALSLFSSQTAVELHISHKPDKAGLTALTEFATKPNGNCLVVLMPTQDWRTQKSKFFTTAKRCGTVLDTSLKHQRDIKALLEIKAQELGLAPTPEAWQLLFKQTQNNIMAGYQALWRASDLVLSAGNSNEPTVLDATALEPALVSQSRYSVYDLADHVLSGRIHDVVRVLSYLRQSAEAPSLVLWVLAAEARKIHGLQAKISPKELGIWQSKLSLYQAAARRTPYATAQHWSGLCIEIDRSIKGMGSTPAWELLTQLALSMAGKQLFSMYKTTA